MAGKYLSSQDFLNRTSNSQVTIQRKFYFGDGSYHWCGGSIIDSEHILTAGHCVHGWVENGERLAYKYQVYILGVKAAGY